MRALVIALTLTLTGACASQPITPPSLEIPLLQGDTSLDGLYHAAANAYLAQVPTMDPGVKATLKPLMIRFYTAVSVADAAQRLGDANTLAAKIGEASALYAQIKPVLHLP